MLLSGVASVFLISKKVLFPAAESGLAAAQVLGDLLFTLNGIPYQFQAGSPLEYSSGFRQWQIHYAGQGNAKNQEIILSLPDDIRDRKHVLLDSEFPEGNKSTHLIYRDDKGNSYDFGRILDGSHKSSRAAVFIDGWDKSGITGKISGRIELNSGKPFVIEKGTFRAKIRERH